MKEILEETLEETLLTRCGKLWTKDIALKLPYCVQFLLRSL